MTSFLSAANSAKIASTTPSQFVPTNSYYDTLPLFVDYQTTALKLPFVSSASYPYLQVSLKTLTELEFILQQAVTTEVDANNEPVTLVDETPILVPAQVVPGTAPPSPILDVETPSDVAYFQVTSPYFRIVVVNTSASVAGLLFMTTKLISTRPSNALQYKDSVLIGALTSAGTATALRCDASGNLVVVASLSPADNQDVTLTARSGTGFLSYLTDNVAVATMPAITGTVAVSSQPPLSYLTDNIAVATQPALAFATDKVDVTGSVVTESSSLIASFDSVSTLQIISTSAGKLQSLSLVNDNNALAFVALYNATSVTLGTTPPLAVVVLQKAQAIQLVTHNLVFSTALSFFTATTYNGAVSLANVYVTASYT